jgi:hypothetical protein
MNKVMVSDELPDGQMIDQWEQIGQDCVQTPLEVNYSTYFLQALSTAAGTILVLDSS